MNFAEIVLYCADTEASRAWYERAGFTYRHGHEDMHWLGAGDVQLMLHPCEGGPEGMSPMFYCTVGDVDAAFAQAVERGFEPTSHQRQGEILAAPITTPWGTREFELVDPDGQVWGFRDR
jgi:uncharacterized glyoxalase superfamily protein PhnB